MIFYKVIRIYRDSVRVLEEGDSRDRAERAFKKAWKKVHSGGLYLLADGVPVRTLSGGYNRTRW